MADPQETKPPLRRRILGRRDAMDPRTRTALSRTIVRDIVETSVYRRSDRIMAYASFGSELRTDEFVRQVLDQGKTLLLSRVDRQKGSLDVYRVRDPVRDLRVGTWDIREPRPDRCVRGAPTPSTSCWFPALHSTGGARVWVTVEVSTTSYWRTASRRGRG